MQTILHNRRNAFNPVVWELRLTKHPPLLIEYVRCGINRHPWRVMPKTNILSVFS
jgi:hypothetical protein